MNKKVPLWLLLLTVWLGLMLALTFGWLVWRIQNSRQGVHTKTDRLIFNIASFPNLVKKSFAEINKPSTLIAPNLFPGINGLKTENNYVDSNYLLLSTYDKRKDQSVAKLIRLANNKVLYEWTPDYASILKLLAGQNKDWPELNQHNMRLYHPLLSADGSLIFNNVSSSLIKIDKNSRLVWAVNGIFHHSVEYDADGNIWAPSLIKPSQYMSGFLNGHRDDALTKISPEGKMLYRKSVAQLLDENGYRWLLLGVGTYERDLLHLNDIKPALTTGKYWAKGDLLISLRNKSTIFLYRPATNEIIWLQTGPWLSQHDVNFIGDDRIGVFGNDVLRDFGEDRLVYGHNNEYIVNFKTGKTETPYTAFFKNANIATPSEGRSDFLPNGDLFIEETNNNRLLRGDTSHIKWQYVDRLDNKTVAALSWSRFVSKEEFKKFTFLANK